MTYLHNLTHNQFQLLINMHSFYNPAYPNESDAIEDLNTTMATVNQMTRKGYVQKSEDGQFVKLTNKAWDILQATGHKR